MTTAAMLVSVFLTATGGGGLLYIPSSDYSVDDLPIAPENVLRQFRSIEDLLPFELDAFNACSYDSKYLDSEPFYTFYMLDEDALQVLIDHPDAKLHQLHGLGRMDYFSPLQVHVQPGTNRICSWYHPPSALLEGAPRDEPVTAAPPIEVARAIERVWRLLAHGPLDRSPDAKLWSRGEDYSYFARLRFNGLELHYKAFSCGAMLESGKIYSAGLHFPETAVFRMNTDPLIDLQTATAKAQKLMIAETGVKKSKIKTDTADLVIAFPPEGRWGIEYVRYEQRKNPYLAWDLFLSSPPPPLVPGKPWSSSNYDPNDFAFLIDAHTGEVVQMRPFLRLGGAGAGTGPPLPFKMRLADITEDTPPPHWPAKPPPPPVKRTFGFDVERFDNVEPFKSFPPLTQEVFEMFDPGPQLFYNPAHPREKHMQPSFEFPEPGWRDKVKDAWENCVDWLGF